MSKEQMTKGSARESRKGTPQVSKWLFYLALLPQSGGFALGRAGLGGAGLPPRLKSHPHRGIRQRMLLCRSKSRRVLPVKKSAGI